MASRSVTLLKNTGLEAKEDPIRGLDHGAWSPLLYMYPKADVPVVQRQAPTRAAAPCRARPRAAPAGREGVLVIGSGHMTHNLRDRTRGENADGPAPYASEFQSWVKDRIDAHDIDSLVNYRELNPHGVRAHPTDEHFLPLFFALGAAGRDYKSERLYDGIEMGALSRWTRTFSPRA